MGKHYIVCHDTLNGAVTDDGTRTLMRGELAEASMFPAKGQWERLVRVGAVKEGTPQEVEIGEALRLQAEALEQALPGHPDQERLSVQRALAERRIAEPPAVPAVPEEVEPPPPIQEQAQAIAAPAAEPAPARRGR